MLTDAMKKQFGLRLADKQEEGIKLPNGAVRTGHGTVIATQSKRTAKKKEATKPVQEVAQGQVPQRQFEEVVFETPIGNISGQYGPIVFSGDWIVMGLSPQSFIPQSFKVNPELRLKFNYDGVDHKVLYTGCRFTDEETARSYIVLMEDK